MRSAYPARLPPAPPAASPVRSGLPGRGRDAPPPPVRPGGRDATPRASYLGAGRYEVSLPGPVVTGGTVKVTAYGSSANFCQVEGWAAESPGQNVFVDCFNTAGTPVNNKFTMTFTASDDLLGDGTSFSGYLWGNDPTSSTYTPSTLYQYDTAGTTATVTRLPPNPGRMGDAVPERSRWRPGRSAGHRVRFHPRALRR